MFCSSKSPLKKTVLIQTVSALFVVALIVGFNPGNAYSAERFSKEFSLNIDSHSSKKLGDEVVGEVMQFFKNAEKAIESENIEGLLALYSDNYSNGPHSKQSIKDTWTRIFADFNNLATIHNMRFVTTTKESSTMIIRCSGILLGTPKGEKYRVTLDTWTNYDHVLVKEEGGWKIIGTSGKETKRFWFDSPMHPLF